MRTLPSAAELVGVSVTAARGVRVHASNKALTHSSFETLSRAEYMVRIQLSDTKTGAVISDIQTGLRMGANDSWNRAVGSLSNGRLLSNQN